MVFGDVSHVEALVAKCLSTLHTLNAHAECCNCAFAHQLVCHTVLDVCFSFVCKFTLLGLRVRHVPSHGKCHDTFQSRQSLLALSSPLLVLGALGRLRCFFINLCFHRFFQRPPPKTSSICGTHSGSASVMQRTPSGMIVSSVSEMLAVPHLVLSSSVSQAAAVPRCIPFALRLFSGAIQLSSSSVMLTHSTGSAFTRCDSNRDSSSVNCRCRCVGICIIAAVCCSRDEGGDDAAARLAAAFDFPFGCAGERDLNLRDGERPGFSKESCLGDGGGDACRVRSPSSCSSSLARACEGPDHLAKSEFLESNALTVHRCNLGFVFADPGELRTVSSNLSDSG